MALAELDQKIEIQRKQTPSFRKKPFHKALVDKSFWSAFIKDEVIPEVKSLGKNPQETTPTNPQHQWQEKPFHQAVIDPEFQKDFYEQQLKPASSSLISSIYNKASNIKSRFFGHSKREPDQPEQPSVVPAKDNKDKITVTPTQIRVTNSRTEFRLQRDNSDYEIIDKSNDPPVPKGSERYSQTSRKKGLLASASLATAIFAGSVFSSGAESPKAESNNPSVSNQPGIELVSNLYQKESADTSVTRQKDTFIVPPYKSAFDRNTLLKSSTEFGRTSNQIVVEIPDRVEPVDVFVREPLLQADLQTVLYTEADPRPNSLGLSGIGYCEEKIAHANDIPAGPDDFDYKQPSDIEAFRDFQLNNELIYSVQLSECLAFLHAANPNSTYFVKYGGKVRDLIIEIGERIIVPRSWPKFLTEIKEAPGVRVVETGRPNP